MYISTTDTCHASCYVTVATVSRGDRNFSAPLQSYETIIYTLRCGPKHSYAMHDYSDRSDGGTAHLDECTGAPEPGIGRQGTFISSCQELLGVESITWFYQHRNLRL